MAASLIILVSFGLVVALFVMGETDSYRPVVILSAGARRAGSTELYNIARAVALVSDPNTLAGWWSDTLGSWRLEEQLPYWHGKATVVMKAHFIYERWMKHVDVVLFTQREVKSLVCSHAMMWYPQMLEAKSCNPWAEYCVKISRANDNNYRTALSASPLPVIVTLTFEELVDPAQLESTAQKIARAMGRNTLESHEIMFVRKFLGGLEEFNLSRESVGAVHHPVTLLHYEHTHSDLQRSACEKYVGCFEEHPICKGFVENVNLLLEGA